MVTTAWAPSALGRNLASELSVTSKSCVLIDFDPRFLCIVPGAVNSKFPMK